MKGIPFIFIATVFFPYAIQIKDLCNPLKICKLKILVQIYINLVCVCEKTRNIMYHYLIQTCCHEKLLLLLLYLNFCLNK